MIAEYKNYILECVLSSGASIRMQFSSEESAQSSRMQIADGMEKGKFQSDNIVHVVADSSTYDIRTSEVTSVSVNDNPAWIRGEKEFRDYRESLGLPNPA